MIDVERDDICALCGKYTENIQHLFFYCEKSLQLLSNLGTFILNKIDETVNFDMFTVVFEYTANYSHPINLIILLTKYYIYTSAKSKRVPNIFALQHLLKDMFEIEETIALKNMNLNNFEKAWRKWKRLFSN